MADKDKGVQDKGVPEKGKAGAGAKKSGGWADLDVFKGLLLLLYSRYRS